VTAFKTKDLIGQPWRLALALQADGWTLRSEIIWHKPNPAPETVNDRPTKAHEYVFLLSRAPRYYYDAEAAREPVTGNAHARRAKLPSNQECGPGAHGSFHRDGRRKPGVTPKSARPGSGIKSNESFAAAVVDVGQVDRNMRSVWTIPVQGYPGAHFATFPEELARRCIVAGSRRGDTVLDPFGGSGTVAQVATGNGRNSIYIDLNPKYLDLAKERIGPMLCEVA
jgi:site-specific DNA-methyltransferase (cytosine-N4-specific)